MRKLLLITLVVVGLGITLNVYADSVGEKRVFFVEPEYDHKGREEVQAVLVRVTSQAYFYIDEKWWQFSAQNQIYQALSDLETEFEQTIYPGVTRAFGSEWNPGIDGDTRITVLFHPLVEGAGGYFSSKDEYTVFEVSNSNEREMIYVSADHLTSTLAPEFVAHEFLHLVTFNQKEKKHSVVEEVWLNEARAEYTATLLGYDTTYEDSNLQRRVQAFLHNPTNSITEWENKKGDYGVVNLFIHYLVDHYGEAILIDSLHSKKTGVASIEEALAAHDFEEDFAQIFLDWTIASFVNDCTLGQKYCYINQHLKDVTVAPNINFLPRTEKSTIIISDVTQHWTGNWYKIIGGKGTLEVEFRGNADTTFQLPYVTRDRSGSNHIAFLELNEFQRATIEIPAFGSDVVSFVLIPSHAENPAASGTGDPFYSFTWSASATNNTQTITPPDTNGTQQGTLITQLRARIVELQAEIAQLQVQLAALLQGQGSEPENGVSISCQQFNHNLAQGMRGTKVTCLQEFLKAEGADVYPEGLVTGYFGPLTNAAVIRFQEKYAAEILAPWGLTKGTGRVGPTTRAKINSPAYSGTD